MADAVLPVSGSTQGRDGRALQQVHVPKGTFIILSNLASNTNPAIWGPDAREWKPERWLSPLPESVSEAKVPGIYSNLCVSSHKVLLCPADLLTISLTG